MKKSVGTSIMNFADTYFVIGLFLSIICGFLAMVFNENIFVGIVFASLLAGSIWVSKILIYGFGQLIENSDKLLEFVTKNENIK